MNGIPRWVELGTDGGRGVRTEAVIDDRNLDAGLVYLRKAVLQVRGYDDLSARVFEVA